MGKFLKSIKYGVTKLLEDQKKLAAERKANMIQIQKENKAADQILGEKVRQARRQAIEQETLKQVRSEAKRKIEAKFKAKKEPGKFPDVVYEY